MRERVDTARPPADARTVLFSFETAAPALRAKEPSLWRNREFMLLWIGDTISLYGTQITILALPLTAIYALDATASFVGFLRFLELLPILLLSLVLGAWVDRRRKRPVLVGSNLARMVLIGLVPVFALTGWLNEASLSVIVILVGVASAFFDVSWLAYVPTVVAERKSFVEANAKLAFSSSSSEAAGPSLAGVLVSAMSAPGALLVDAASYLLSVILLLRIRAVEAQPPPPAEDRHLGRELAEGVRLVWNDPRLRSIAFIGLGCNFVVMFVSSLFVLYAVRTMQLSAAALGLLLSVGAAGAVLGAAGAGPLMKRCHTGPLFSLAITAVFLGPALIPVAGGPQPLVYAVLVVSLFASYAGLSIANVIVVTLRQLVTPREMMARMSAAMRTMLFGGAAFGALLSGIAGDVFGLRGGLVCGAVVGAVLLVPCLRTPVARLTDLPVQA
jgi:MFS family permease